MCGALRLLFCSINVVIRIESPWIWLALHLRVQMLHTNLILVKYFLVVFLLLRWWQLVLYASLIHTLCMRCLLNSFRKSIFSLIDIVTYGLLVELNIAFVGNLLVWILCLILMLWFVTFNKVLLFGLYAIVFLFEALVECLVLLTIDVVQLRSTILTDITIRHLHHELYDIVLVIVLHFWRWRLNLWRGWCVVTHYFHLPWDVLLLPFYLISDLAQHVLISSL